MLRYSKQATESSVSTLATSRQTVLEGLRRRAVIHARQEPTYTDQGTPLSWIIDTRPLLLDAPMLVEIARLFWAWADDAPLQLACLELTGIPLMVGLQAFALRTGRAVNGVILRKEAKTAGRGRAMEGELDEHPIVFVDDILNSGSSLEIAQSRLALSGRRIDRAWALISFRPGYDLSKRGLPSCDTVFTLDELGLERGRVRKRILHPLGEILWHKPPATLHAFSHVAPKSTPALDVDSIYLGSDSGVFRCLAQADGSERWRYTVRSFSHKGIWSSPVLNGDHVFFGAYDGNLYCLDRRTGKPLWITGEADWIGSSPALAPELEILSIGLEHAFSEMQGSIAGFDTQSGRKLWEHPTPAFVHGSPCYLPELQCFVTGTNAGQLICLGAREGNVLWTAKADGPIKSRATWDRDSDLLLFGSFDHHLYAVSASTGILRWRTRTRGILYAQPLIQDGLVYVPSNDKNFYVMRLDDGSIVHRWSAGSGLLSSPARLGRRIVFGSHSGAIYGWSPRKGRVVSRLQLGDRVTTAIVTNPGLPHLAFAHCNSGHLYGFTPLKRPTGSISAH